MPDSVERVMRSLSRYTAANPDADLTVAGQLAVWMAQEESQEAIQRKFPFSSANEAVAREIVGTAEPPKETVASQSEQGSEFLARVRTRAQEYRDGPSSAPPDQDFLTRFREIRDSVTASADVPVSGAQEHPLAGFLRERRRALDDSAARDSGFVERYLRAIRDSASARGQAAQALQARAEGEAKLARWWRRTVIGGGAASALLLLGWMVALARSRPTHRAFWSKQVRIAVWLCWYAAGFALIAGAVADVGGGNGMRGLAIGLLGLAILPVVRSRVRAFTDTADPRRLAIAASIVVVLLAVAVRVVSTRYDVECFASAGCYVLDRWTGQVELRR